MAKRLASEVRAFASSKGIEVGKRGRLSAEVFSAYITSQTPAKVREIAAEAGVEVPAKGRISNEAVSTLASALR